MVDPLAPMLGAALVLGMTGCKPEGSPAKVTELEKEVKVLTAEIAEARIARRDEVESLQKELGKERQDRAEERLRLERERDRAISFLDRVEGRKNGNSSSSFILETPGRETAEAPAPTNAAPVAASAQLTDAVILIEGDKSRGTGFMVRQDGKHYLYTAAHVFSGNSRLTASNTGGRKFTKFGNLEVADGADLVRLQVLEENPGAMLPVKASNGVAVGSEIVALGDGGGAGVVSELKGRIVGLSAESVEVDAGIIQGNSGGPVILAATGEVIGVVTHLTAKREDVWSEGTRFSDVRRFACRLDRSWNWHPLPISTFLAEAKQIADYDRMTKVGFAISSMNPSIHGLRLDTQLAENATALSVLTAAQDVPIVAELIKMNTDLVARRVRSSESDLLKRFRSMLASSISQVNQGANSFNPEKFSPYHKQDGTLSVEWRGKANEALKERLDSLSQ